MRPLVARGLGAAALLAAGLARAEPPPAGGAPPDPAHSARLSYTRGPGAEQCPDEDAVRSAVSARLGYDPFHAAAERSVSAIVRRAGRALRAEVALRDASGTVRGRRTLEAAQDDCVELIGAMALAISLAIDPESTPLPSPPPPSPSAPPPSPSSLAPPPTPSSPEPVAAGPVPSAPASSSMPVAAIPSLPPPRSLARPAAPSEPSLRRPSWHVGLGGAIVAGTAPGLSGAITAEIGARWGAFSVSLEGRADPPTSASAAGGGSVSASLLLLSLVPCWRGRLVLVCGLGSAGALRGTGAGVLHPLEDVTPYGAAGLRLGVEIPLNRWLSAGVHGDLVATLTRTTLQLDDLAVWTTPSASAALGAGLLAHFP